MFDNQELNRFSAVSDFKSLVGYLHDELEWPIEGGDFEDLTFDYSPEELGIDSKFAPKFLSIKRLRPLEVDQPWGIFFIHFETSSLPVVALRRLLSGLVLKARSKKNIGNRTSWHADDLLLISQFEDGLEGNLTFAHFESHPDKLDMPTLRVLGWDAFDTKLKHEHVVNVLKKCLVWPVNPTDQSSWRNAWSSAFELTNREVIRSSSELAQALATLALKIRYRLRDLAAIEHSAGPIHKIMNQLKASLIADLDINSFSDIYAQTIAYGLFAARVVEPKSNTADAVGKSLAGLNPLLVDLLSKFAHLAGRREDAQYSIDFDELGISEVVELLDSLNIDAILRDFGDRNQREDPVMFFFEGFLSHYDNKIKKERGVFYTPRAAVSFIVKSIDIRLRENFKLNDGLADLATWRDMENKGFSIPPQTSPDEFFVQILDPAVGTGTFIVEVIDLVYKTMSDKWLSEGISHQRLNAYWNDYVASGLLPRLTGFELMMAPYAIAHLKISLKLVETGYQFSGDQRLQVYLTNALEPASDRPLSEKIDDAFLNEDKMVWSVKTNKAFTIIMGNPPYSVSSKNKNSHIEGMMASYKRAVRSEKNIQPLSDDYVKFIRMAQSCLEFSGTGMIGLITNNAYLSGFIFRGVREELSKAFSVIELLNLNGNQVIARSNTDGLKDENIFDIQQGICASFFTSLNTVEKMKGVHYSSIEGPRTKKSETLEKETMASVQIQELEVSHPDYLFMPRDQEGLEEYQRGWSIDQIFKENVSGVKTHRDKLVFGFTRDEVLERMRLFSSEKETDDYFISGFAVKERGSWKLSKARELVRQSGDLSSQILPCLYRPFDVRYLFYSDYVIDRSRRALMKNMYLVDSNLAMLAMRQVAVGDEYTHLGVSDCMIDNRAFFSNRGIVNLFPALIADDNGKVRQNLTPEFIGHIERTLGLSVSPEATGDLLDNFGAVNVIRYCHAIFYSTEYKNKFAHLLPFGFPKIPITSSLETFRKLENLGQLLVDLQLLKFSKLIAQHVEFPQSGSNRIEKISVGKSEDRDQCCRVFINKTQYFEGPIRSVINRKYGGYSVCEKWLNERKGAYVDDDLIQSFNRLLHALVEMETVIKRVDQLIVDAGGLDSVFAV